MLRNAQNLNGGRYPSPQMPKRNITHVYANALMQEEMAAAPTRSHSPTPTAALKSIEVTAPESTPPQDVIGSVVGDFGIWQLRTVLIIFLCKIPASWFMACIIFTAPELYPGTEFECDTSVLAANQNVSDNQCYVLEDTGGGSENVKEITQSRCTQFVYDSDFQSLIMEFDLVCFRDILVAWTQYWHLFGVLVGGVMGTKMMLLISPRNTYFSGMFAQIVCGVVTGYARDFNLHCAFRCLSAVCCAIMFTAGQAIFADITAGVYRLGAIILYDTFWSIGVILLPELASWFNNWTYIYLGITFPTLILMLLLNWTPDSPRWLLKNGTADDVNRVEYMIREAASINQREFKVPHDLRQQLESLRNKMQKAPPPAAWRELWRGHYRAKTHMVAAHLALAAFVINFMGMLLNIRSFGRDYLVTNTIAMGFAEIFGCFLALHFMLKYDKWKWQCAGIFNIIAGVIGCLGWIFSGNDTMDPILKVTIWMIIATIPKAGVSCAQSMLLACMNELMPAPKKVPFVFSVVTWARVWLLSAPFFNVLKKIDVALSLCSYSVLSIIGGICTCLLLTPRSACSEFKAPVVSETPPATVKKDPSPLNAAVWTVDEDTYNTHL